jgi:NAD(P)-dependent dehydrogenase (short-subunit alcohol dehydrogenase family)
MIATAVDRFGGLHVLVNNAGGGGHIGPHYPDAPAGTWGATLALNLTGAMRATQLALEPMLAAGGGAVVNMASSAGIGTESYRSPEYAAAKAGLIRFTTAAGELRPGVRVNCVVPGWIATERAARELDAMGEAEAAAAPVPIPMDVVADAVVELVRDDGAAGRVTVIPDHRR